MPMVLHASLPMPTPQYPGSGARFTDGSETGITYRWSTVPGATVYDIYIYDRVTKSIVYRNQKVLASSCSSSQCSIRPGANLSVGKTHSWRVRAKSPNANSGFTQTNFDVMPGVVQISAPSVVKLGTHVPITFNDSLPGTYELFEDGKRLSIRTSSPINRNNPAQGTRSYKLRRCENGICSNFGSTRTVKVVPPPTLTYYYDDTNLTIGDRHKGIWSSTNTTKCENNSGYNLGTSGSSYYTRKFVGNGSSTAICTGLDGSKVTKVAKYYVNALPATSFSSTPSTHNGSITIRWNAVNNANYKVERKRGSSWESSQIVSGTSYSDSGLRADSDYTYRVTTCYQGNYCTNSKQSSVIKSAIPDPVQISAPSTVNARQAIPISFNDSLPGTYELYEDGRRLAVRTSSPISRSTPQSGTRSYKMKRCYNGLCGPFGNTINVNVKFPAPTLTYSYDDTNITIGDRHTGTWSSTNTSECHNNSGTNLGTSGSSSFTRTHIGNGSSTAICTGLDGSTISKVATYYVNPLPATSIISAPTSHDGSVTISWSSVTNANYKLERLVGSSWQGITTTSSTSYTDNGLNARNNYTYRVTTCYQGNHCTNSTQTSLIKSRVIDPVQISAPTSVGARVTIPITFDDSLPGEYELFEDDRLLSRRTSSPINRGTPASGTRSYKMRRCDVGVCGPFGNTINVSVAYPAPTLTFSYDKQNITIGDRHTGTWSSTNTSECHNNSGTDLGTSGSFSPVRTHIGDGSSTAICTGLNGATISKVATYYVNPLPATSIVSAPSAHNGSVAIEWSAVNNANYKVERQSGSTWQALATVTETSYTDTSLAAESDAMYRITTCYQGTHCTNSVETNTIVSQVPKAVTISAPASVNAQESISITFDDSESGNYELYEDGNLLSVGTSSPINRSTPTSGIRSYKVRLCNGDICGPFGNTVNVNVAFAAPTLTYSYDKQDITIGDQHTGTWSSTNTSECHNSSGTDLGTSGSSIYTRTHIGDGSSTAICTGLDGTTVSKVATYYVNPLPATSVTTAPVSHDGSITIEWTEVTNANYKVERLENGVWQTLATVNEASYSDTGLTKANDYQYKVTTCYQGEHCTNSVETSLIVTEVLKPVQISAPASVNAGTSIEITFDDKLPGTYELYEDGRRLTVRAESPISRGTPKNGTRTYKMRRCNGGECGEFGPEISVVVNPSALPVTITNLKYEPNPGVVGQTQTLSFDYTNSTKCYAPGGSPNREVHDVVYFNGEKKSGKYTWTSTVRSEAEQFSLLVVCRNEIGEIDNASVTNVVAYPATSSVTAAASGSNSIVVNWTEVSGANYKVERQVNGGTWEALTTVSNNQFTDTDYAAESDYAYRVTSCYNGQLCEFSRESNVLLSNVLKPIQISAPESVDAGNPILITFDDSKPGTYELFEDDRLLSTRTSSPISRSTPKNGTRTYKMRRCDGGECGEFGNEINVVVNPSALPVTITNLKYEPNPGVVGQTQTFSFDYTNSTKCYAPGRRSTREVNDVVYFDGEKKSGTFTWTSPVRTEAEQFSLVVVCKNEISENDDAAVTNIVAYPAVDSVVASTLETGENAVNWTAVAGANFKVERQVNGGDWEVLGVVADIQYTDSDITENSSYVYKVSSCHNGELCQFSNVSNAIVGGSPIPLPEISALQYTPNPAVIGQEQTLSFSYKNALKCSVPADKSERETHEVVYFEGTEMQSGDYSWTSKPRTEAEEFSITVVCVNAAGSAELTVTNVVIAGLEAPTVTIEYLEPSNYLVNDYRVRWNAVAGAVSYELEASFDGGETWPEVVTTEELSQEYLEPGPGEYIYRVKACDADGVCGQVSTEKSINIQIPMGQCAVE